MEELIRQQQGVVDTVVGYTGGGAFTEGGDYTLDAEAVQITYDPELVSYRQLLDLFFRIHDPTTINQQGNDRGEEYRSAIFYADKQERAQSEAFIELVNDSGRWENPVVTTLEPLNVFTPAEDSHQDYLQKNPDGYTCHRIRFDSYLTDETS